MIYNTKIKIKEIIILALLFLCIVSIVLYSNSQIDQTVVLCSFICAFILFAFTYIKGSPIFFGIVILNIVSLIFTGYLHSGLGCIFVYGTLMLLSITLHRIELTSIYYKLVHILLGLFLMLYICMCDIQYMYTGYAYDLFGNKINANMYALITLAAWFHLIMASEVCNNLQRHVICILSTGMALYFIWISNCRSVLIAVAVFGALYIVLKKPLDVKVYRGIILTILLTALVFPLIYIGLKEQLSEVVVLGKNLYTGRDIVWESALSLIKENPVLGGGTEKLFDYVGGVYTHSAHNTVLAMWKTIGIIPTITFICFFGSMLRFSEASNMRVICTSQCVFIAVLVITIFECIYTESHLYILFVLLLLCNVKEEKSRNETPKNTLLLVRRE